MCKAWSIDGKISQHLYPLADENYLSEIFYGSRHTLARMANPDFVMLAQSMGVHAIQCDTSEELPRKMKLGV